MECCSVDPYLWNETGIYSSGYVWCRYQDESGMYCAFFYTCFDVYCLHKFSKYIPYKLSIEKQRSVVDAWGLDLQNVI